MGQSTMATQDRSEMATSNLGAVEGGGTTSWNHVKTFALVGVSRLSPCARSREHD
jgi:hypothetical protein